MKNGVLKPHIWDPVLNRSYADMAEFFHTHIDPCRLGESRDKGKVERDVPTARELFRALVADHPRASLSELNHLAERWLLEEYGIRKHGTTGEPPLARFASDERPALTALPEMPYTIGRWAQAIVHPDHYIQVLGHRFTLSTEYIGRTVQVMLTPKLAKIYLENELIKTLPLEEGRMTYTDLADYPASVQFALSEKTPRRLIRQAREAGGAPYEQLVTGLLSVPGFSYLRRVMGLRETAQGYSFTVVEHAARLALTLEKPVTTYLFKHLLEEARRDEQEAPSFEGLPLSAATEGFMRDADYFRSEEEGRQVANG